MAEQNKQSLSRLAYRRIKQMDRTQLSDYVMKVYLNGYEAGRKAATPDVLFRTFREVLMSIDSIGPTRADAIMKKLSDTFALKENNDEPTEAAGNPAEADGNAEETTGTETSKDGPSVNDAKYERDMAKIDAAFAENEEVQQNESERCEN